LLRTLKTRHQLTLLFISHDLAVVKNISDRIAVMYLGKLCEISPSEAVYRSPLHPYTASLLDAVSRIAAPLRSATRHRKATEFPSPVNPPAGCHFHPRCPYRQPVCQTQSPPMRQIASDRWAACHFPIEDPVAIVDPK
jgi:peptide/nickel transport system ATP-binding protein